MAVEETKFVTLMRDGRFEVRAYEPQIAAEVLVDGTFEAAGNRAFRSLFRYIDGDNRAAEKIAMTAPVAQRPARENIAMTAPVTQEKKGLQWAVSFTMPASFTMETLPTPTDPSITLRAHPAHHVAAIRYSGSWSEGNYQRNLDALRAWMGEHALESVGEPIWARYNAPFVPWFLRRNEILVPIAKPLFEPSADSGQ